MEQHSTDIKAHWHKAKNVGDTLTPILLENLCGIEVEYVEREYKGKFIGVGSLLNRMEDGDIIWGSGLIKKKKIRRNNITVLALRGKISNKLIGADCKVFGDPGLLLPLIYNPEIEQINDIGIIPHYIDKKQFKEQKIIDIEQNWKDFVDEIKSYKKIISSSLHGIVIAEAYGIPAEHKPFSNSVIGGSFKFKDYLSGTERRPIEKGEYPPIVNLDAIQQRLLEALESYFV